MNHFDFDLFVIGGGYIACEFASILNLRVNQVLGYRAINKVCYFSCSV